MTVLDFLILIVVAAVLGLATQALFGFHVGGFFASVVLGFLGGWLGTYLAGALKLPFRDTIRISGHGEFSIVWSILGTLFVILIVGWVQNSRFFRSPSSNR